MCHSLRVGCIAPSLPQAFSACKAVTMGDAANEYLPDPKKVIMELYVNRGHRSAQQLKRVLVNSDGEDMHSATYVDEASGHCEDCRGSDGAPHVPIARTSAVSMSIEISQVDLLFLGDLTAMRATDFSPKSEKPSGGFGGSPRCLDWGLWAAKEYSDGSKPRTEG